jgi:hypothetical protein
MLSERSILLILRYRMTEGEERKEKMGERHIVILLLFHEVG